MRVVIVGAGDVGTHIAEDLRDTHDLVVVDADPKRVEQVESSLGVTAIEGDGRSLDTLETVGIREAGVIVATTDDDAVNVMVCGAVNNVTEAFTIARAKSADLYKTWRKFDDAFGIDLLLSIDRLTADAVVRTVTLPGALSVGSFVEGTVEMAEFEVDADDPLANKSIEEADEFPSLTFAGVLREGKVLIPSGDTVIEPGDRIVVIGSPSSVRRFATRLAPATLDKDDDIVIVGGGEVGYRIATRFEERGFTPQLIEHDTERADELTERLSNTTVVEGDVTSFEFLAEQDIDEAADFFIGTLDDETNYVLAVLASNLGVTRTTTIVNEEEYVDLFEAAGVDIVIQPHAVVARETTRATREYVDEAAMLERDSAEVLEITVENDSVLAGKSLESVARTLPDGFVVGAVVRGGSLTTPRGGTVIQVGDHVVAFVDTDVLDEVASVL